MNLLESLLKYRSTKHWGRYSKMEKWKDEKLRNTTSLRIADIGAGHNPFLDATHIIDKYPDDNSERTRDLKVGNRELIVADIASVPVEDKYFDFVYTRHILEHVDDPEAACKELMRIGKRGFIEGPLAISEVGYGYPGEERGWPFHKWYNWVTPDQTLVFKRKTKENLDDYCSCMYGNFCYSVFEYYKNDFNRFFRRLPYPIRGFSMTWEGDFKFRIIDE
jgi:SAM-dependent methyltransferase